MFKIFFIGVLVAVYYFSVISYKPNQDENKEYVKTSNTWKFVELDEKTNTVYEYLGDYWHGNLKVYKSDFLNKKTKKTMGELFDYTEKRFVKISEMGYNIKYIWESSNEIKKFSSKLEI